VRRAHRKNILLAIIIGILFSAVVVAVILFQNRNPF
jgi:cell division protein FtsL